MEHEPVFFLMQTAVPRHQLRSAFMRNSVHGWVYLETTMNKDLVQHLLLSPGVVRRNAGIIQEQLILQIGRRFLVNTILLLIVIWLLGIGCGCSKGHTKAELHPKPHKS